MRSTLVLILCLSLPLPQGAIAEGNESGGPKRKWGRVQVPVPERVTEKSCEEPLVTVQMESPMSKGELAVVTDDKASVRSHSALGAVSPVRARIVKDMVVDLDELFNRETLRAFENAYKELVYGKDGDFSSFTFEAARANFVTLKPADQLIIAKHIWDVVIKKYKLNAKTWTEPDLIRFSESLKLSVAETRRRIALLRPYQTNSALRREVLATIIAGYPDFLKFAATYLVDFEYQSFRDGSGSEGVKSWRSNPKTDGNKHAYSENRWRVIAKVALVTTAVLTPIVYGVPWEPLVEYTSSYYGTQFLTYWDQFEFFGDGIRDNRYEIDADQVKKLSLFLTNEFASLASGVLSFIGLQKFRPVMRKLFHRPRFLKRLQSGMLSGQISPSREVSLIDSLDQAALENQLEANVEKFADFSAYEKQFELLHPSSKVYVDAAYADFGEDLIGRRNMLVSSALAQIRVLLDERYFLRELSRQIRAAVESKRVGELSQRTFLESVGDRISKRKEMLSKIRTELGAIETFANETIKNTEAYLSHGQRLLKSDADLKKESQARRNLTEQLLALQDQLQTAEVISAAIARLDANSAGETRNLTQVSNSLTLMNLGQAINGSGTIEADWLDLAKKLE